jgi:hypothetical protein
MTVSLVVLIVLMTLSIVLGALLREPKLLLTENTKTQEKA